MKNKKLLKSIAALAMGAAMVASSFSLVACGDKHTHTFADTWSSDATNHWHAATCEHTDEKADVAAHVDTNPADGKCDVCNYTMSTPHTHTFAEAWTTSETQHWHAATCDHTDQKSDVGNHVDTNPADGKCDVCQYPMPTTPPPATELVTKWIDFEEKTVGEAVTTISEDYGISFVANNSDATKKVLKENTKEGEEGAQTVKTNTSKFAGDEVSLTKYLDLAGTFGTSNNYLSVEATKNMIVYVYALSGGSGDSRKLATYSGTDKSSLTNEASIGNNVSGELGVACFNIYEGDSVFIGSTGSGIRIYGIGIVEIGEDDVENADEKVVGEPVTAVEATCAATGNVEYSVTNYGRYKFANGSYGAQNDTIVAKKAHEYDPVTLPDAVNTELPTATEGKTITINCKNEACSHASTTVALPDLTSTSYTREAADDQTKYTYTDKTTGAVISFTTTTVEPVYSGVEGTYTYTPDETAGLVGSTSDGTAQAQAIMELSASGFTKKADYLQFDSGGTITFTFEVEANTTVRFNYKITSGSDKPDIGLSFTASGAGFESEVKPSQTLPKKNDVVEASLEFTATEAGEITIVITRVAGPKGAASVRLNSLELVVTKAGAAA